MNSHSMPAGGHHWWWAAERRRTTAIQDGAAAVGWILLVLGIAGFVPVFTTGYSGIALAGPDSTAELFGVFEVSVLSNLLHLALGVLGLFMAWTRVGARRFLAWVGVFFVLLSMYGFTVSGTDAGNFLPQSRAVDWLHLVLGLVMIAMAIFLHKRLPESSEARDEGDFGEPLRGEPR